MRRPRRSNGVSTGKWPSGSPLGVMQVISASISTSRIRLGRAGGFMAMPMSALPLSTPSSSASMRTDSIVTCTSGCSAMNSASTGGTRCCDSSAVAWMRSTPARPVRKSQALRCTASCTTKSGSASAIRMRASAVGTSRLLTRSNSAMPSLVSASLIALLTAGCDMPSSSAAPMVVRQRITARRTSSWRRLIRERNCGSDIGVGEGPERAT